MNKKGLITKKNIGLLLILVLFGIQLQRCSHNDPAAKFPELIEFRTLTAGQSDTLYLDELLYSQNYDYTFSANPHLEVKYNPDQRALILNPRKDFTGLTFLEFKNEKKQSRLLPLLIKQKIPVVFHYTPPDSVSAIFVMGNFNTWDRSSLPMHDHDHDGTYSRTVNLDEGIYEYQFVVGSREIWDPKNPEKVDNGFGSYNSLLRVKSHYKSAAPQLHFLPGSGTKLNIVINQKEFTAPDKLFVLKNNQFYPDQYISLSDSLAVIDLNPLSNSEKELNILRLVATRQGYPGNVLTVWIKNNHVLTSQDLFLWQDAIIYSLMIDRFCNGDTTIDQPIQNPYLAPQANFRGGDLTGIIQKIEQGYFDRLGINTLWISPVNKTTDKAYQEWPEPHRYFSGYHGYWPVASNQTEPRFGSLTEFKELVKTAHGHDLKILLDFVSNHVHIEHPYYQEHPEWFGTYNLADGRQNIRRWNEFRLTTWFDTFLPSFDFIHSSTARDTMVANALWWLQETGIDGFRHDATKHVPKKFWKSLTHRIKAQINPAKPINIFQIGESFGSNQLIKDYVNNGMLDAQFNFNQFFTQRRIFAEKSGHFQDLELSIRKSLEDFGYNHLMGNIMDSHDQVRMMAYLDNDLSLSDNGTERAWQQPLIQVDSESAYQKELVLMTYLLTVPGVPIIYYGDEWGMTGANDPDNRRMMRFGEQLQPIQQDQFHKISELIRIRKNHSALRRGDYLNLYTSKDVMLYSRGDCFERLIIALNKSGQKKPITITLPAWMQKQNLHSLLNDQIIAVEDKLQLNLPAYSGHIYLCR